MSQVLLGLATAEGISSRRRRTGWALLGAMVAAALLAIARRLNDERGRKGRAASGRVTASGTSGGIARLSRRVLKRLVDRYQPSWPTAEGMPASEEITPLTSLTFTLPGAEGTSPELAEDAEAEVDAEGQDVPTLEPSATSRLVRAGAGSVDAPAPPRGTTTMPAGGVAPRGALTGTHMAAGVPPARPRTGLLAAILSRRFFARYAFRAFAKWTYRTEAAVHALNVSLTLWLKRELARIALPLRSWEYYRAVYSLLGSKRAAPDIFHANDLDTLAVAVLLARRHRKPLLYDAQELYTGMHTLPAWYRGWLGLQERILIHRADRVTVVNDAIAEVMEKIYGRKVDSVILNCPPFEPAPSGEMGDTIREALGFGGEAKVMLYSGGLTPDRGIESTLLALKHLPEWRLIILGEGPLKHELLALARRAGLSDRVSYVDFVPHSEVPRFISSADVGVIPYHNVGINHYLCSPSKLFHYMMAELPIACSDFPFLRRVVAEHQVGATFDPSDPQSIARAVREIADDARVYSEIKARLKLVKRRYSWEEEEKRLMAVYRSLDPVLHAG